METVATAAGRTGASGWVHRRTGDLFFGHPHYVAIEPVAVPVFIAAIGSSRRSTFAVGRLDDGDWVRERALSARPGPVGRSARPAEPSAWAHFD